MFVSGVQISPFFKDISHIVLETHSTPVWFHLNYYSYNATTLFPQKVTGELGLQHMNLKKCSSTVSYIQHVPSWTHDLSSQTWSFPSVPRCNEWRHQPASQSVSRAVLRELCLTNPTHIVYYYMLAYSGISKIHPPPSSISISSCLKPSSPLDWPSTIAAWLADLLQLLTQKKKKYKSNCVTFTTI